MRCRGQAFLFLRPKLLKISYEKDVYIYVIGPPAEHIQDVYMRPWPTK